MSNGLTTPFIDLLPALSADETAALKRRIADEGGVHDPVLLTEAGEVLDGRNRLIIDPNAPTKVIPGSGGWSQAEKQAFVIRCNLGRRNISAEQIKEICKPIAAELKKERKTQAQIGKLLGVARETVRNWLDPKRNNGQQANVSPDCRVIIPKESQQRIADIVDAGKSTAAVAAELKVSRRRIQQIVSKAAKQRDRISKFQTRLPPVVKANGRDARLFRKKETKQICIEFQPNEAGLNIGRLLEEKKSLPELREQLTEAEQMEAEAKRLERQAKRLRKQADEARSKVKDTARDLIIAEWGEIHPLTESITYNIHDFERFRQLTSMSHQEALDVLLGSPEWAEITGRQYWGDIRYLSFERLEPISGGWTGIGSIDQSLTMQLGGNGAGECPQGRTVLQGAVPREETGPRVNA